MHVCRVCVARKYVHALVSTAEVLRSALTGPESETVKFGLKVIPAALCQIWFSSIDLYPLIGLFIGLQNILDGYEQEGKI